VTTKMQTAMATLVAAVPAGVLGYFVVNSFLGGLEHLPTTYQGLYGATLAGCAVMVFMPFAVLIFGPKAPKRAAGESVKAAKKGKGSDSKGVDAVEKSTPELAAEAIEETERPVSTGELEVVEPTASEAEMDAFDNFGGQDESKTDTFDAFTDEGSSEDIVRTPEEAEEIGAKTQSIVVPDDDEFAFEDEEVAPPKKKKK
jgi:hypothetical protein